MHALVCPLCHIALPPVDNVCARDGHTGCEVAWLPVPPALRQRFQVVEPFAHGDTGSLYIADEPETGRRGLLKILAPVDKEQLGERQRLRRELVKQATLVRTHLVVPLASGETDGTTWLFREWLDGVALEVRLSREGALQQTEALAIAAQIASALDELHRGGLLHRDVKPGHIFLQPTPHGIPRALLLDAGLTGVLAARSTTNTAVYGTPGYIAPEQLLGKLVSFRSDLYSLGCTLYRMLTGRPAFPGESLDEILAAQRYGELPPMPADLPNGIGVLLQSILAKDPQQRPFSAQKLRRTLEPFLPDGALMEKQPTTTFETMPEPKPSVAPQPSGTLRPPAPPSVRPSRPAPPASASLRPPTTHSAPPPPPPRAAPREDGTQQIDISQIEEMRPAGAAGLRSRTQDPRTATRAASVPPPTPGAASSVPPPVPANLRSRTNEPPAAVPARLAEKTQPIRLDQILAVNNARRAAASNPPPAHKEPPLAQPPLAQPPVVQPQHAIPPALAQAAQAADHEVDDDPLGFDDEFGHEDELGHEDGHEDELGLDDDDDAGDDEKTRVAQSPLGTGAGTLSPSQRPLFSMQDEPFSPALQTEREEPALFATPRQSFAAPQPVAKSAAEPPSALLQAESADDDVEDFLSSAQPPSAALRAGAEASMSSLARKGTLLGMGIDPGQPLPAFDPSLEMPTIELRTRELDRPSLEGGDAARSDERDHPTERVSLVTPSEPSESGSGLDASLSLGESEPPAGQGGFRDSRRMVMYASAALVGLALLGVGASALRSSPEASATRSVEASVPPPLPAALPAASAPEPAASAPASAPALAEAPHPTVEPLGPSVTSLEPSAAPQVSAPAAEPAREVAAEAVPPVPAAPVAADTRDAVLRSRAEEPRASTDAPAEAKHTHHHHRSSKRDDDDDGARASSKSRDSTVSHGKAASANAKSTKSAPADKSADKAALFAAARDDARNAYAAKNYKEAAAAYERAAKYDPKHPGTFAGLGAARLQLGDNKAAVQAYQRAVQLSPQTSGFHAALGRAYASLGDKSKAVAAYKKALAIDPKNEAAKTAIKQLGG